MCVVSKLQNKKILDFFSLRIFYNKNQTKFRFVERNQQKLKKKKLNKTKFIKNKRYIFQKNLHIYFFKLNNNLYFKNKQNRNLNIKY